MRKQIQQLLLFCVWLYRKLVSPWLTPRCRFLPTCSAYAIDAIELHGPYKGGLLAIKRIARCHPWGKSGFDPVEKKTVTSREQK